jgi:drug/metabolite transporter (DMT)-like permease
MGAARFVIAGSLLYAWSRMRGAPRPRALEWRVTAIAGALLFLGGQGSVVWAETRISSGMTAVIVSTTPIWLLLIYWLMPGGRKPGNLMLVAQRIRRS